MRTHWLRLRATALPTEDPERVAAAMVHLAAVEATPVGTALDAHHGGQVVMLDLGLTRQQDVRACLGRLGAVRPALRGDLDDRVDEDGVLYLRFDKQAAAHGLVRLAGGADTIQVRVKPQVHPFSRDGALAVLRAWADTAPGAPTA